MVDILRKIVTEYPDALEDIKKLKGLLKDLYVDNKLMQNLLAMVAESGILRDIYQRDNLNRFQMYGYIKCLTTDYGISDSLAKKAIELWAAALDKKYEIINVEDENSNNEPKQMGEVLDYSRVSVADFKTKGKISKFTGEGNKVIPNVKITEGTYIVRASNCYASIYDSAGNGETVIYAKGESYSEDIFTPSYLKVDKPIFMKISSTGKWELELIPVV